VRGGHPRAPGGPRRPWQPSTSVDSRAVRRPLCGSPLRWPWTSTPVRRHTGSRVSQDTRPRWPPAHTGVATAHAGLSSPSTARLAIPSQPPHYPPHRLRCRRPRTTCQKHGAPHSHSAYWCMAHSPPCTAPSGGTSVSPSHQHTLAASHCPPGSTGTPPPPPQTACKTAQSPPPRVARCCCLDSCGRPSMVRCPSLYGTYVVEYHVAYGNAS